MTMPVIQTPVFNILVPSLNRKRKFRPFLMRENKALMIAQASGDSDTMGETLRKVIQSCSMEDEGFDASELATFDLEYLLCKLRSISVGNTVTLILQCDSETGHEGDDHSREANVIMDLEKVEVLGMKDFKREIMLTDELSLLMKTPMFENMNLSNDENDSDWTKSMRTIAQNIDKIFTKDGVTNCAEESEEDVLNFVESLTLEQYTKIRDWFETIPECAVKVEWRCPHCGKYNARYVKGFADFFA